MFLALQEEEILFFLCNFHSLRFHRGTELPEGAFSAWRVSQNCQNCQSFQKGLSGHGRFKLTIHWQNASCSEMFYKERTINGRVFPEMDPRKSLCLLWRDKLPMKLVVVDK